MEHESEVVNLVHELVLQSRPVSNPEEIFAAVPAPTRLTTNSVPSSPCGGVSRSQSFPVRKKVAIKSAPLRPPDIGNPSLFPSVEESGTLTSSSSSSSSSALSTPKRIQPQLISTKSAPQTQKVTSPTTSHPHSNSGLQSGGNINNNNNNGFGTSALSGSGGEDAYNQKILTLEAKMTTRGFQSGGFSKQETPRRASLNLLSDLPTTPSSSGRKPRSAKYLDLSPERREKLEELARKYSTSIDCNHCRNVLDELEFIFQLLNSSTSSSTSLQLGNHNNEKPLLSSSLEQSYFVIHVIFNQLDGTLSSIPSQILQQIIENYPHKVPKAIRKQIEDRILSQQASRKLTTLDNPVPVDLSSDLSKSLTVTFQSEKDGRSNFPHQTDFHAFCKQRDLFYSIRESWSLPNPATTGSGNNNGAINSNTITDRSKARMSFPPPNPSRSSSSNSTSGDTISFKVHSLFQMNRSPTNLFHMASLFVSHYILEARAQEVGGVPKDDHMKSFFQSNPAKLVQLNSRFSATSSAAETLETDRDLVINLAFQKQFLLSSSVKFLQHVIDRLVEEIYQSEVSLDNVDLSNANLGHLVCRSVKDLVHLARLLGYALSIPYLNEDQRNQNAATTTIDKESITKEHLHFRSYQLCPLDLKSYLDKAKNSHRLTTTCPWILEFLLQCDPVTLLLPAYQPILMSLMTIYKTKLRVKADGLSSQDKYLSTSSRNFLRFYFGILFSSKNFPDSVFSFGPVETSEDSCGRVEDDGKRDNGGISTVDSLNLTAHNLTDYFFQETFNRFKRILSWGKLDVSNPAITGEFRHIRPIPAPDKSKSNSSLKATLSRDKLLQSQLEATFFDLYSPSVKRTVDFIVERMTFNFVTIAKTQLFPNFRLILAGEHIFGVRAAEKCKVRLADEMNRYVEKCCIMVRMFLEHQVTGGVLGLCQRIAIRKSKEAGSEWINSFINAGMFPDVGVGPTDTDTKGAAPSGNSITGAQPVKAAQVPEDPPFEILILIHRTLRKLHQGEKVDAQLIDKILACQAAGRVPWTYNALVDWGIGLITLQPQVLTSVRIRQLVGLWKGNWNCSSATKIINPRNLMLLDKQSGNSRDSWIKLGSVTQQLISDGLIKPEDVERQCFQLLRENWPNGVHKRLSEYLTIVLETFQERAGGVDWRHGESAQVLDWVAWLCSGQSDQD